MKILVVDDHPLIREALPQVLRALDSTMELLQAATCAEAMERTRLNPDIALVLLDLALPGVDGFEALRQLRQEFPAIPVVVLSAYEQPDTVMRAIDGGAMGFIPKTSHTPLLIQALRLVLSGGIYLPPSIVGKQEPAAPVGSGLSTALPNLRNPRDIGLTDRQCQVLALMLQGKPNKLICRELNLAENTVKIHISAILRALSVHNRTQAVIAASKLGLKLPPPLAAR
jgi:DNA-binding NarL/FixJ family response regulator